METMPGRQKGASAIVTLVLLAVLGYGIYVGIDYAPQFFEEQTIDSILRSVRENHKVERFDDEYAVKTEVINLLQINEMDDMTENFFVNREDGGFKITFSYDRELNLVYETRKIHYEKTMVLQ